MTTVLALHGFSGGPASFDRLRAVLGPTVRFVAPDLAGHGPEPRFVASYEDEVRVIADLARGLEDELVVLGYSLGGRVALGLLGRVPIRAAVVVAAHPGLRDPVEVEARLADDRRLSQRLVADGPEAFFEAWEALPLFATQRELPDPVREERAALRRSHRPEGLASALLALSLGAMPDHRAAIAAATHPIHFVVGDRDPKFLALASEVVSLTSSARLDVVAGVGHDVLLEAPEGVAAILTTVLGDIG